MPATVAVKTCPNCGTPVQSGKALCTKCGIAVKQMDAFAAAKKAAERKGFKKATIESTGPKPLWQRRSVWAILVFVGIGVAYIINVITTRPPPAWTKLPNTPLASVEKFMKFIAADDDAGEDKAYGMLAPTVRKEDDSDEQGRYRQIYHNMCLYLKGEFGDDWINSMKLETNPNDPNYITVHIDIETLHVSTMMRTPDDHLKTYGQHYAILGIQEFDIADAAKDQQMAAIMGVVGAEAGGAAVRNLKSVFGASGAGHHETPMQNKIRLLPDLRDPRGINKYEIFQTWPSRNDPVMRRRLTLLSQDDRYSPEMKEAAQQVLTNNVAEEELIAAHAQSD